MDSRMDELLSNTTQVMALDDTQIEPRIEPPVFRKNSGYAIDSLRRFELLQMNESPLKCKRFMGGVEEQSSSHRKREVRCQRPGNNNVGRKGKPRCEACRRINAKVQNSRICSSYWNSVNTNQFGFHANTVPRGT